MFLLIKILVTRCADSVVYFCCSWVKEFGGRNGLNAILNSLNLCADKSVAAVSYDLFVVL